MAVDSKSKEADKSKSKASATKSRSKRSSKLDASLYFMKQTEKEFQKYTRMVNDLYFKKLYEHCAKRKLVEEEIIDEEEEREQFSKEKKEKAKEDLDVMKEKLKERLKEANVFEVSNEPQKQKLTSLVEMAALGRLKTLIELSGRLLELLDKTHNWSKANKKLLCSHSALDVFKYAEDMFEATTTIGEIFGLEALDRKAAEQQFIKLLTKPEHTYKGRENTELEVSDSGKKYIPALEARINHYRTAVNIVGSSLLSTIQTYVRFIHQEQVELRPNDVILALKAKLPPMYLHVDDMKLSTETADLLREAPPNALTFPLAPAKDTSLRSTSGKGVVGSGKSKKQQKSGQTKEEHTRENSNRSKSIKRIEVDKGKSRKSHKHTERTKKKKKKSSKSHKGEASRKEKAQESGKSTKTKTDKTVEGDD